MPTTIVNDESMEDTQKSKDRSRIRSLGAGAGASDDGTLLLKRQETSSSKETPPELEMPAVTAKTERPPKTQQVEENPQQAANGKEVCSFCVPGFALLFNFLQRQKRR